MRHRTRASGLSLCHEHCDEPPPGLAHARADEFATDVANLEAYLRILGKKTPQFKHEIAEKTLVIGLGSTAFRTAKYTSHEVSVDDEQIDWFEKVHAHSGDACRTRPSDASLACRTSVAVSTRG